MSLKENSTEYPTNELPQLDDVLDPAPPAEQPNDAPSPLVDMEFPTESLPTYDPDADAEPSEDANLFAAYDEDAPSAMLWDEALFADGTPRPRYAQAMEHFAQIGLNELADRQQKMEALEMERGVTYKVTGEDAPRVFPVDFIPRVISDETWKFLSEGLEQRARALNAFLDDVYGPKKIVEVGIVDDFDLQRAPGYTEAGFLQPPGSVRAQVCGMDLICTDEGRWYVLEDNLRVPSGITFSNSIRSIEKELFGEVMENYDMLDPSGAFDMIRATLISCVPKNAMDPANPKLAVISSGPEDSAWFEHHQIAELIGAPVCIPDQLAVRDGYLHHRTDDGEILPLDTVYVRIEMETLFAAEGFDGKQLGPDLEEALKNHRLIFANAFGNGVGDDKAIYAYVPQMIRFYLDEEPILDQVPTCLCHKPGEVDTVLDRLEQVVVKPVDGYGGQGITIGPECSAEELEERARELREYPERFIAQDVVRLSTLPTYGEDTTGEMSIHPRHVDLRAFVHVRPARPASSDATGATDAVASNGEEGVSAHNLTAHTVPAALTRTAAAGSLIVNTSRGGGGKDTWILRNPVEWGDNVPVAGSLVDDEDEGPVVMDQ